MAQSWQSPLAELLAQEQGTFHYSCSAFLDCESQELQEQAMGYFRYAAN